MIRPVIAQDVPKLAQLHMRAGESGNYTLDEIRQAYDSNFGRIFLDNPWYDERIPSLVHEESDGRITGLLGVMSRSMSFKDQRITMAVSSRLTVDPDSRARLAGVKLMKAFLKGPQDLSVADLANRASEKLWHAMGGATSKLYSLNWSRMLRACGTVASKIRQRRFLSPIGRMARPLAQMLDRFAGKRVSSSFAVEQPTGHTEDLDPELFLNYLPLFTQHDVLSPIYDHRSSNWIFSRLGNMWDAGSVYKVLVRNDCEDVIGWFIYNLEPGEYGQVAQVAATETTIHDVLRHLFYHAWKNGAVGMEGRLQPRFMQAMSDLHCRFHCTDELALVHSDDPDVVHAFETGDAFVTALEGEGCMYLSMTADCSEPAVTPPPSNEPLCMPMTSDGEVDIDRVEQLVAEAIR